MPQITFSDESRADLNRIRNFMNEVAPHKTAEAIITIIDGIDQLAIHPLIGKAHLLIQCLISGNYLSAMVKQVTSSSIL